MQSRAAAAGSLLKDEHCFIIQATEARNLGEEQTVVFTQPLVLIAHENRSSCSRGWRRKRGREKLMRSRRRQGGWWERGPRRRRLILVGKWWRMRVPALLLLLRWWSGVSPSTLQAFPPVNLAQQLLLPSPEKLVCEFPTIWNNLPEALHGWSKQASNNVKKRLKNFVSQVLESSGCRKGKKVILGANACSRTDSILIRQKEEEEEVGNSITTASSSKSPRQLMRLT